MSLAAGEVKLDDEEVQASPGDLTERWESEWERLLWKPKSHPDNFVPSSFLSSLSRNANFRPHSYVYLVAASFVVSQHLATVFNFLAVFVFLKERYLDPRILVWISILAFVLGYLVLEVLNRHSLPTNIRYANRAKAVKSSILVFLALLSLSPVLRTLTAATSSDSIWALSASLFVLNVLLADYSVAEHKGVSGERLTSVLSMNAAISSSVVLASRLVDDLSVFALILFSVQSFALFPIFRRHIQSNSHPTVIIMLTACLVGGSMILMASFSTSMAYLYGFILLFVTFVAPGILIWAQVFKNELKGSWDPAVPKVNPVLN